MGIAPIRADRTDRTDRKDGSPKDYPAAHFAIQRHLSRCAGASGKFAVLAIDHRANLAEDMAKARGRPTSKQDMLAFKRAAIHGLAGSYDAVLADPEYGFPALADPALTNNPGNPERESGLLAPLEVTDYSAHPSRRETVFIENWGVEGIVRSGGNGAKLLLFFHPESARAAAQTEGVDRIGAQCRAWGLPFFLEPVVCPLDPDQPLSNEERTQVTVETARHFSQRSVDVLKMPFPLNPDADPDTWEPALRDLDEACAIPWTLLSGGVSFELFSKQAEAACRAGASGVIAGRAVWGEGVALEGDALNAFMKTTARQRMETLAALCNRYGTPWHGRSQRPELPATWYASGR